METATVERVLVHVRVRPFSDTELADADLARSSIVAATADPPTITVRKDYDKKSFRFDSVFENATKQEEIYQKTAHSVIQSILIGYNATILAYGQTGTGKTHTMVGGEGEEKGVIPRALEHVLGAVHQDPEYSYIINIGFVQVYMEMLQDLLFPDSLTPIKIREDPTEGVYLTGSTWKSVHTLSDCMNLLQVGDSNRNAAFTSMNAHSSRSHAVFIVKIEKRLQRTDDDERSTSQVISSTLNLVDLAGSERVKKSRATGLRFDEAKNINLALLALGNCIQALADKKNKYVPYRDSKLTRLLANSLGGSSKTSLIITVGPSLVHVAETLSTLNFGSRAMKIEITPNISRVVDYKALCAKLKAELAISNEKYMALSKTNASLLKDIEVLKQEVEHLTMEKLKAEQAAKEYLRLLEGSKESGKAAVEMERLNELQAVCEHKLRAKEADYAKLLKDFDQFIQESDQENADLRREKANLLESNHNYKEKLQFLASEMETEKRTFTGLLTELKQENLLLKRHLDDFREEIRAKDEDKKCDEMRKKVQDDKLKKLMKELEELKRLKPGLRSITEEDRIREKNQIIAELETANARLQVELHDTEMILGEKREEIEQMRLEMSKVDGRQLKRDLDKAKKEIDAFSKAKSNLENQVSDLTFQLKRVSERLNAPSSPASESKSESRIVELLLGGLRDSLEVDFEQLEEKLTAIIRPAKGGVSVEQEVVTDFAESLYAATHPEKINQISAMQTAICDLEDQLKITTMREESQKSRADVLLSEIAEMRKRLPEGDKPRDELQDQVYFEDLSSEEGEEAEMLLDEFAEGMASYLTELLVLQTEYEALKSSLDSKPLSPQNSFVTLAKELGLEDKTTMESSLISGNERAVFVSEVEKEAASLLNEFPREGLRAVEAEIEALNERLGCEIAVSPSRTLPIHPLVTATQELTSEANLDTSERQIERVLWHKLEAVSLPAPAFHPSAVVPRNTQEQVFVCLFFEKRAKIRLLAEVLNLASQKSALKDAVRFLLNECARRSRTIHQLQSEGKDLEVRLAREAQSFSQYKHESAQLQKSQEHMDLCARKIQRRWRAYKHTQFRSQALNSASKLSNEAKALLALLSQANAKAGQVAIHSSFKSLNSNLSRLSQRLLTARSNLHKI